MNFNAVSTVPVVKGKRHMYVITVGGSFAKAQTVTDGDGILHLQVGPLLITVPRATMYH